MDFLVDYLLNFSTVGVHVVVFLLLLICGLGVPIPEDLTLIAAGMLVYYEGSNVWIMVGVTFVGILLGDSIVYYLGTHVGRRITQKAFFGRILSPERLDQVRQKFKKHGNKIFFAARFMPGLRAPVFFSAGTLRVPYGIFILYDGLAALISVPAIVYCVYLFADKIDNVLSVITGIRHSIVLIIAIIIALMTLKWFLFKNRQSKIRSKKK